jgi:hypothetical protein
MTRIAKSWMALAAAGLALALAGCASESAEQQAWRACTGVEPWPVHSECLREQYRRQDAQEAQAATLLLGATAFMNGMNQARPVTTTCFTTGMMTQCTSP